MKNLSKFGIIDKLPYGILNLSSDFKIEYVNQYAASVLKIDDSQDKFNIFSQIWVDKFGNPIADGEHPIELCFKTKNQTNDVILGISAGNDDTFNWINSHLIPEFDDSKKLISLCFTFNKTEPTNHNQIEDEKIYKSMFESNPQPMWIYDQETLEFLDVNNSAISHYGYNRDEFLKMTILDIRPETEIKKLIDDIRNTNLDLNYAGNWLHRKKNGDIIEVEVISQLINNQGRKARHVLINDITDRKIAEQKKHEAEILFRTLVEKSTEAIFIVNEHGRPVFVSHTSIKMLGYSEEEVRSMQFRDVVHPDDLDSIENTFRKVLEFPESEVKLFGRQRQKSGNYIWCEGSATNWLDDPYIKGIVVNFRDVTDRIQKEEFLQKRKELLKQMSKIAKIGGWEFDCSTMKQEWTDETYVIHDLDKENYNPNAQEELSRFEPGSKEKIEKAFELAFNQGEPYDLEVEMTTVKGNRKWVRAVCSPIMMDGKVIKLTGTVQDITELKKIENDLITSEQRFITLFKSNPTPSGIISVGDFKIVDVNNAWCKLTGYNCKEAIGKSAIELGLVEAQTFEKVKQILQSKQSMLQNEIKLITRFGEERHVLVNSEIIKLNDEKLILNNLLDITERKKTEQKLLESEERYRKLAENFPNTTITFYDKNLKVTFVTGQELLNSNNSAENFIGKTPEEILIPELAKLSIESFKKAFEGEINSFESESFNGRIIRVISVPIVESNGEINEIQVISQNITEQKKAENERILTNKKFSMLFNSSGTPTMMFKMPEGIISEVNQKVVSLTGFTKDELIGRTSIEVGLVKPESRGKMLELVKLNDALFDFELQIITKNGETKVVLVNAVHFKIDIDSYVITTWFDITDRIKAENIIKESEERYRSLFEVSPDAIFINVDNRIELVNDSCLKLFGASKKEDLIGKTPFDLFHSDYHLLIKNRIEKMLLNNSSSPLIEKKVVRLDGKVIDVEVIANTFNLNGKTAINFILRDITDRLTTQELIKKSEENYRKLFYNSPVGYLVIKDGVFVDCNNASIELIGGDKSYLIGKSPAELSPEVQPNGRNSIEYANELIGTAFIKGRNSFEWTQIKVDGTPFVSQVDLSIMNQSDDQIILVSWQDITEKYNTLNNLKESEERFRNLFERMTQGVIYQNADGYITAANDAAQEMLGLSLDQLQGRTSYDPEWRALKEDGSDFPGDLHPATISLKTGKALTDVIMGVYHPKANSHRWIKIHTTPVFKGDSNKPYAVFAIFDDITTKKLDHEELENYRHRLEEIVELRTQELKINQEKLIKTQKMVKLGSWEIDIRTKNTTWSNELYNIFERDQKLPPYKLQEFINTVIDEEKEEFLEFIEIAKRVTIINSKIFRHQTESGSAVYLEHNIETEFENNEPIKIVGSVQDVTKQKLTELELNKAVKDAEIANKSKSEFLANMSHEIRTPLNSIIGFSELLYNQVKDEKSRSQLETIRKSGKTLLKIINDILDLSKVEAGKIIIENEPLDIFLLIKDVVQMFEQSLKEKKLILYIELLTDLNTRVMLDETRLRQILFNLIGNAIKFTHIGRIEILINHIEKNNGNIDLCIKINDTGIGIPKDQLSSIFEPFVQKQGQILKKFGGTGLGLAISRRMVEALGGRIEVHSELNKGSEFTITLFDVVTVNTISEKSKSTKLLDSSIRFDNSRILIVDDIPENRNLLIDVLEPTGITIFDTDNGLDAINLANDKNPDIILMDIRMPGIDGIETTRILKQSSKTSKIPFIAVTASVRYGPVDNWIDELFTEYLTKPIDIEKLFILLSKYLQPTIISDNRLHILDHTDSENIGLTEEKINITDIKLKQLLIDELEPEFKKVSGSHLIDEIEDFGKKLILIGTENQNEFLKGLGKNICSYVELFDIDKINKSLNEFNKLMDKIKV